MIEANLLPRVMDQVAIHANDLADVLVSHLRKTFPGVTISVCSDNDMPPRMLPVAGNTFCRLYYVDSGGHCLRLTTNADAASGLVVALCDWDSE